VISALWASDEELQLEDCLRLPQKSPCTIEGRSTFGIPMNMTNTQFFDIKDHGPQNMDLQSDLYNIVKSADVIAVTITWEVASEPYVEAYNTVSINMYFNTLAKIIYPLTQSFRHMILVVTAGSDVLNQPEYVGMKQDIFRNLNVALITAAAEDQSVRNTIKWSSVVFFNVDEPEDSVNDFRDQFLLMFRKKEGGFNFQSQGNKNIMGKRRKRRLKFMIIFF